MSSSAASWALLTCGQVASTTSRPSLARVVDDRGIDAVGADDERAVVDLVEARGDLDAALASASTACGLWMSGPSVWTSAPLSAASSASFSARSTP